MQLKNHVQRGQSSLFFIHKLFDWNILKKYSAGLVAIFRILTVLSYMVLNSDRCYQELKICQQYEIVCSVSGICISRKQAVSRFCDTRFYRNDNFRRNTIKEKRLVYLIKLFKRALQHRTISSYYSNYNCLSYCLSLCSISFLAIVWSIQCLIIPLTSSS